MKKKAEGMSLRETFAIHRRAARDMRRIAPGCFTPFILCAVVEAASPYAVIWLSARLVDELSTLRRPEILAKWVLWIVAVSAAAELLKAVLERWKNVRSELLDRQKEVLYTEKFLRMDYADCDRQETRDLFSQIRQNADWSGWGFAHLKLYYTQAVQGITGILGAAALTVSLFTRQVPTSAGKIDRSQSSAFPCGHSSADCRRYLPWPGAGRQSLFCLEHAGRAGMLRQSRVQPLRFHAAGGQGKRHGSQNVPPK